MIDSIKSVIDGYPDGAGISLSVIESDEGRDYVLVRGDSRSLRLLGELLIACSGEESFDGFQIGPDGAGAMYFSPQSMLGIYVDRQ